MESLKRFLAVGLLMFGLSAFAANPAYESFKGTNGVVLTTPGIGAARVVVVSGELFQPGSTNLTNWANLPTNVVSGANIWTQSGGTAFPTSAGAIIATNVQSWDKLISKGAFIAETRSRTLTTGTNTLAVLTNSYLLLDSPTNDAASVVVQIGPATSSGQLLFVVNNQTNRAFTIYDGSASGSGIVELQGNFVSTNLGGLILMNQGNWVEVGRFSPAGLTTSATINPTDGVIPVRGNATTFTNSPLTVVDADTVRFTHSTGPETFRLGISTGGHGNLIAGTASDLYFGINNNGSGDIAMVGTAFQPVVSNTWSLGSNTRPWKDLYLQTNSLYFGTNKYTDNGASLLRNGVAVGASSGPTFADLVWTNNAGVIETLAYGTNLQFNPGVADSSSAAVLRANSTNLLTDPNALLLRLSNKNTNRFLISGRGEIRVEGAPSASTLLDISSHTSQIGDLLKITGAGGAAVIEVFPLGGLYITSEATDGTPVLYLDGENLGGSSPILEAYDLPGRMVFRIANQGPLEIGSTTRWNHWVTNGATAIAYDFTTLNNLSTAGAKLASFKNGSSLEHFYIANTNGIATPAITAYGAVSKAWQFGAGSNNVDVLLRATNMAEVTIDGVGAVLIPYARK